MALTSEQVIQGMFELMKQQGEILEELREERIATRAGAERASKKIRRRSWTGTR